jgi:hypothetical protein
MHASSSCSDPTCRAPLPGTPFRTASRSDWSSRDHRGAGDRPCAARSSPRHRTDLCVPAGPGGSWPVPRRCREKGAQYFVHGHQATLYKNLHKICRTLRTRLVALCPTPRLWGSTKPFGRISRSRTPDARLGVQRLDVHDRIVDRNVHEDRRFVVSLVEKDDVSACRRLPPEFFVPHEQAREEHVHQMFRCVTSPRPSGSGGRVWPCMGLLLDASL